MRAGAVFNEKAFFAHLGGDIELGLEILIVYVVDAPARAESLAEALEAEDQDRVIKFSHALKGISATIRAEKITMLAEKVERAARKNQLDEAKQVMPLIAEQLDSVLEMVKSILSEHGK
ncbi:Hpt domain-containing protein [Maridesulfovibrio hydrothermalis]|uniref:Hpt protein n=1 Tax=Maridesulfovibrio hydrothermalis AM13 = DSM 14728 TaxID=1121451 RepID=L0RDM2_9BACT|nr:Hpt domain-containing protein [Maridesulfovibrio hydrothermalis]CCO23666.1 Hpt protein [Maridesulfovibrio hydrothermalis AM13 = DSM 14728]